MINTLISLVSLLLLMSNIHADSLHSQLQKLSIQLQKSPTDTVLREKIIKLGLKIKPAPLLPPEAERKMVRGGAAFKDATAVNGYQDAAKEFEQVTQLAPWYGDAYYNLGVTQDKAKDYSAALQSLKFALLASPNSKDIKNLIYEVEYRNEKANSPEAFVASLEGANYICQEFRNEDDATRVEITVKDGKITGSNVIIWINPKLTPGVNYAWNAFVGFRGAWFEDIPLKGQVNVHRANSGEIRVEISEDRLSFVQQVTYAGHSSPTVFPEQTCLRKR